MFANLCRSTLGLWFLAGMVFVLREASAQSLQASDDQMFRQLDRNGDGKITLEEAGPGARQLVQQLLQMAGKETSGSINREEFGRLAEQHRRGGGQTPPRAETPARSEAPASSNLRVSRADLRRMLDQFSQLDRDKDGFLDAEELQSASRTRSEDGNVRTEPANPPRSNTPTPARGGQDRLSGTWRGWVVDGRGETPNSGAMQMELRIDGNRMTARELGTNRAGGALGGGTFVVNSATGNLDATGTDGPQQNKSFLGIFQVDGDTLRWCVGNQGRPRPTEFATRGGNYLMVLHREAAR
uniref:TIGR03067 domain-containing protein n=1 Tax=Schlesneria paludicola TaxID=360056 RepID=A0A7C2P236_9PLAN